MRDQEIIGLWEAYQQVHTQEEVEQLDEAIYSEKGKAKAAEMIAKRSTPSGRAKSGKGANVAQIRQIRGSGRGRFDREGLGGTPMTPTMAKNPIKKQNYDGTGNKAARRAAELKNEEVDIFDIILEHLVAEGYAETNEAALAIMANMSEEWRQDIMEISDRKVKAVRNARENQWNKQFGKNRVQDPTDDMVDKVDKLIDQRNKRTGSNVKKTTLGQLADKSAARIRSKAKDNG